jgi:lambda family phage portal protein
MAAVINGFFTVFITSTKNPAEINFGGLDETESSDEEGSSNYGLGPGMINILEPGEDIKMADPSRPTGNFDAFTSAYSKYIGAALEIPVELLLKSFMSSYSASKAALEEAWKAFSMKRSWLANDFCQPIYEIWLHEAVGSGRIKAPGFFLDPAIKRAYCRADWNGPAKGMLDPLKEINAAKGRVDLGISTREIETIEQSGGDFDSNVQQLIRESEAMKKINQKNKKGGSDN